MVVSMRTKKFVHRLTHPRGLSALLQRVKGALVMEGPASWDVSPEVLQKLEKDLSRLKSA